MYVPKKNPPPDFCGCPPCPICYDKVNPNKRGSGEAIDSIQAMGLELLGREPTALEVPSLVRAAQTIHQQNLLRKKDEEDFRTRVHEKHAGMVAEAVIKDVLRARNTPQPKPLNTVNLDDMDTGKVRRKTRTVKISKEEKLAALRAEYRVAIANGEGVRAAEIYARGARLRQQMQ